MVPPAGYQCLYTVYPSQFINYFPPNKGIYKREVHITDERLFKGDLSYSYVLHLNSEISLIASSDLESPLFRPTYTHIKKHCCTVGSSKYNTFFSFLLLFRIHFQTITFLQS